MKSWHTTTQPDGSDKCDWAALRGEFPAAERFVYLDIARKAILPRWVKAAVDEWLRDIDECAGTHAFDMAGVEATRHTVARVFGAPAGNMALIKNTSEGINIVAQGFPLAPGDNVVISDFEHENNTFPWRHLQGKGVEVRCAEPDGEGRVTVDCYRACVDNKTRIISSAWVAYGNGWRCDVPTLAQFCHENDIRLVIDGIQGVGVLATPLAELGADVVVAGGHKAQFSLSGAGLMYANDDMIDAIHPPYAAKFSFTSNDRRQLAPELAGDGHRFEYGNPNFLGAWVQRCSAEHLEQIGLANIEARIRHLTTRLIDGAETLGLTVATPSHWSQRAGIVSLDLPGDSEGIVANLRREDIVCSTRDRYVRASVHFYNTEEDIDRFLRNLGVS